MRAYMNAEQHYQFTALYQLMPSVRKECGVGDLAAPLGQSGRITCVELHMSTGLMARQ